MHLARFCPRCAAPLEKRVPPLDDRPRMVCASCSFVVYVNPRLAAGTLPVRDGRVALIRRAVEPRKGAWSWPCGYVEIDESVEEAAVRETAEETGLQVALGPMLGLYSFPVRPEEGHLPTSGIVVAAFPVEALTGELVAGDDADDARWCPLDGIPWEDLAFASSRMALTDLLRRLGLPHPTP